jgi:hypothetical protein
MTNGSLTGKSELGERDLDDLIRGKFPDQRKKTQNTPLCEKMRHWLLNQINNNLEDRIERTRIIIFLGKRYYGPDQILD